MKWLLALGSAALLILTFPPFDVYWLAPFALAPLMFVALLEERWKGRFWMGLASGALYWFGVCNWIHFTLETHGGMGKTAAWLVFVLFCVAKALQTAAFTVVAGWTLRSRLAVPATAALWVLIEYTHAPLGFAWLMLGNTTESIDLTMRLAPFTGVWGISFVLAAISAETANLAGRRRGMPGLGLVLVPLLWLLPKLDPAAPGRERAVLVQPNIDETTEWTQDLYDHLLNRMEVLSLEGLQHAQPRAGLLIWPESPAPFYDNDAAFMRYLENIARIGQVHFLAGLVAHAPDGQILNSAMLFEPDGSISSRYDKVNLVPFGEFVPWPLGPIAFRISREAGDFRAGTRQVVSKVNDHRIATFICYESVFPGFIRGFAREGAEVLFNPSNDGWFGKTAARDQHLRIVRMRAAENRRWILRATNDGLTAAIDSAGRVRERLSPYVEDSKVLEFSYEAEMTVYTRFGDWWVAVCALLVLVSQLWRITSTSPSFTMYSLPSSLKRPFSRRPG